jgi:hypothetical protein
MQGGMTDQRAGEHEAPSLQVSPNARDTPRRRVAPSGQTETKEDETVPVRGRTGKGPRHRRVEAPSREALRAPQRRWNPGRSP